MALPSEDEACETVAGRGCAWIVGEPRAPRCEDLPPPDSGGDTAAGEVVGEGGCAVLPQDVAAPGLLLGLALLTLARGRR